MLRIFFIVCQYFFSIEMQIAMQQFVYRGEAVKNMLLFSQSTPKYISLTICNKNAKIYFQKTFLEIYKVCYFLKCFILHLSTFFFNHKILNTCVLVIICLFIKKRKKKMVRIFFQACFSTQENSDPVKNITSNIYHCISFF